ncbi:glycosyltransferase family A protein [Williamsia sp. 1135]|uniref:glycosyltransferase family 2 protein n=1 Tax=Williamsia sp. 1135 TaxID=1889262 RepID=UPI001F0AF519|nr:glycosyltransferase family A protein [Williamsia sp. 1135]
MALANVRRVGSLAEPSGPIDEPVWVCIPARDEASRITSLISDLKAQTGIPDLRVLICDDDSSDGTGDIATAAIADDPRFELYRNDIPPPPGWTGKIHAMTLLADRVGEGMIAFVDADVRLAPTALARGVRTCGNAGGLLSVWPAQRAGSVFEHLVQPLLCWSWLGSVPLGVSERLQWRSMAVANGQFLITSSADYRRSGGHASVRGKITDDLALAREYRDIGLGSTVRSGKDVASCRMYDGPAETWQGYRRWLGTEFGGPAGAVAVAVVFGWANLIPLVDVAAGRRRRRAAAALACSIASRLIARRVETGALGRPDVLSAIAHPLSMIISAVAVADSLRARVTGKLIWKGRTLAP